MNCEICRKEVNQLNTRWGKKICNTCLGANWPRIYGEHQDEINKLKDQVRRRNIQIKDLKKEIEQIGEGLIECSKCKHKDKTKNFERIEPLPY